MPGPLFQRLLSTGKSGYPYSEGGWECVENGVTRYRAAGDRHRLKRHQEQTDPESGLSHLAHEAWNRLAELELEIRKSKEIHA